MCAAIHRYVFFCLYSSIFANAISILFVKYNTNLSDLLKTLKIPLKKVAIELNQEIIDKKKLNKQILKNNDKIEIVHFIGGG